LGAIVTVVTSFPEHDVHVLTTAEDIAAAAAVFRTAMVGLPLPAFGGDLAPYIEPGRTLGVRDGDQVIGGADSYTGWLAVPGGVRVPHAGVTHVGVLPTHTRRGAVTALLRRQLHDIAERGEVVATLRASEAVIYERFGYGVATYAADYQLDRRRGALRGTVPAAGPVRLADPAASGKLLAGIYAQAAWPGAVDRSQYWWNFRELIASASPGPRYLAVHGPEGAEDGYVSYHPADTASWFQSRDRAVVVDDLIAHSERAYLGLVRYLAERDLIDTVLLPGRPVDDPLPLLVGDTRAVQVGNVRDETWLRLVDVPAALAARTYSPATGAVVIAVTDDLLPANAGRYRVWPGGAHRTSDPADISLGVAALGAAYLGGTRFTALAPAGRATEHRPGALAEADALFATPRAPFAGTGF
jgi:predicted acetyltransferase